MFVRPLESLLQSGVLGDRSDGELLREFITALQRDRRACIRGAGDAAQADGLAGLPLRACRTTRCRGRLPGDVPGPG